MDLTARRIRADRHGETLVLTLLRDLRALDFQGVEEDEAAVLRLLEAESALRHVLVDFGATGYFGSPALMFFVRLWRLAQQRGGRLAFCNASATHWGIVQVAGFADIWPRYRTREEALAAAGG